MLIVETVAKVRRMFRDQHSIRESEPPPPVPTPSSLTLGLMPAADCARYDGLRTLVSA